MTLLFSIVPDYYGTEKMRSKLAIGFWFILPTSRHDNGYIDGRSSIHFTLTNGPRPSQSQGRSALTFVNVLALLANASLHVMNVCCATCKWCATSCMYLPKVWKLTPKTIYVAVDALLTYLALILSISCRTVYGQQAEVSSSLGQPLMSLSCPRSSLFSVDHYATLTYMSLLFWLFLCCHQHGNIRFWCFHEKNLLNILFFLTTFVQLLILVFVSMSLCSLCFSFISFQFSY